jgi:hypothetical protein
MAQEAWLADEIEVIVSGAFTTHHRLETTAGLLGTFTLPAFSSTGLFHFANGRELTLRRVSWWRGQHELHEGETLLGSSYPQGFFRREIVVLFGEREYRLTPVSFWNRTWHLTDEVGTVLLEIQPRGVFRRGAYLTIFGAVDAALLVFAYYLIHNRWQEEAAAGAAAAS